MPFTDPNSIYTPSSGTAVPAAWLSQVRTNQKWFADDKPRARVYRTSAQSIPSGAATMVLFDAERYDVGGCHSTVSNTSRLTVPSGGDGLYVMGANLLLAAAAGGARQCGLRINGSVFLGITSAVPETIYGNYFAISTEYELAAGDYVEVFVFQDTGAAVNLAATGGPHTSDFFFRWVANRA
jgi:hypothetical protein